MNHSDIIVKFLIPSILTLPAIYTVWPKKITRHDVFSFTFDNKQFVNERYYCTLQLYDQFNNKVKSVPHCNFGSDINNKLTNYQRSKMPLFLVLYANTIIGYRISYEIFYSFHDFDSFWKPKKKTLIGDMAVFMIGSLSLALMSYFITYPSTLHYELFVDKHLSFFFFAAFFAFIFLFMLFNHLLPYLSKRKIKLLLTNKE